MLILVVVDVSALTRGVRLLSVEVPLTAVPAGPAASPAADIERGTCPPPFGPLQLLQSAAQLSVSVSLAVPLDLLPRPAPARCAYGRLLAVVSQRGLQRSGVLQLIQQLNEPPSPAAAEGAAPRRPGDVSTPGISGFCLVDRQLHLLFAEGRADAELEQTAAAPRALPRRDARLCHHSGFCLGSACTRASRPRSAATGSGAGRCRQGRGHQPRGSARAPAATTRSAQMRATASLGLP
ncbi:hypothetical protein FJT64_015922 [Amphibalanus amphitrite]|uniref:Uncharacterized protein n=1 Tax=Amphibalanus amphitrite TaxID=1232801 RepID=A0A6A4X2L7_AMPAM|nr:hypothetical protein FJT64_015922 [Amphibalanus amphitrite]